MKTADVYEKVTARIIAALEAGTVPWRKGWTNAPRSVHGHKYRGINALILGLSGYASPVWITYQQARKEGGYVRQGEKGTPVILWKRTERRMKDPETGEELAVGSFYATTYTVFNVEQCADLPPELYETRDEPAELESAEDIVARYVNGPSITHGGDRACYSPELDAVRLPPRAAFESAEEYYSTLFHELTHSTGHESRLDRDLKPLALDSHAYSREELVAELGAAFLCARAGLTNPALLANQAAYCKGWLGWLKDDRRLLVLAASAAQRAVDHIMGEATSSAGTGETAAAA
jgi:antirestriction protein ArdC